MMAIVFRGPVARHSYRSDASINKQVSFLAIIASQQGCQDVDSKEYHWLAACSRHPPRRRRRPHTKELIGGLLLLAIISSAVAGYWQSLIISWDVLCTMGVSIIA
jgi:hypothetical protein